MMSRLEHVWIDIRTSENIKKLLYPNFGLNLNFWLVMDKIGFILP